MKRRITKEVKIGNVLIGANNPIAIQSMTSTHTKDVEDTVEQIKRLVCAHCDIVRVAVLDIEDAKAIKDIKIELAKVSINVPLVADIHFDYRLALEAIDAGCDKIRLNPGNIKNPEHIKMVVDKCIEKNIPIRIGVNTGSIDKEIYDQYGRSAKSLFLSAKKEVKLLESFGFTNIVLSLKASDLNMAIEAYELASKEFDYPLHIGITEAGTAFRGTVKSSIGIGHLLLEGIGDTIRVSLTDDPVMEVKAAREILSSLDLLKKPILISCPTCGRCKVDMIEIAKIVDEFLETIDLEEISVAVMGCAVNGPGEAKDADVGIAGGDNEAVLFKKGEIIKKVPQNEIVSELKKEILDIIKK